MADNRDHAGRLVILTDDPLAVARSRLAGRRLVTPNERAARNIGAWDAGATGLQQAALRLLANGEGVWAAPPETQLTALRAVLAATLAPADLSGTAKAYAPAVRELLRAGLGRPGVAAALAAATPELPVRSLRLLEVATRYREQLAEYQAVEPAEMLWRAGAPNGASEVVLVAGYPRLGADELALVDAWAANGSVLVLPLGFQSNSDAAQWLKQRGWDLQEHVAEGPGLGVALGRRFTAAFGLAASGDQAAATGPARANAGDARIAAWSADDQEAEVRLVLGQVKELLASGAAASEVVLVTRDERSYGPLLSAVAVEYRVPLKLSYGVPLSRTKLGDLVSLVAKVVAQDLPFEDSARLLSHPFVRLLGSEGWRSARERHPEGQRAWRDILAEAAVLAWPHRAAHRDYLQLLEETLDALGALPRIRAEPLESRAWRKLVTALRRPPGAGGRDTANAGSRAQFAAAVDETLELYSVSVDSPWTQGVELHSPLAIAGAGYRHVFVLGAAESVLPATVADDPVLDFHQRTALQAAGLPLEDALAAAERESLSFLPTLHAAAESFTITYPAMLEGREAIASPYFAALGLLPRPAPARPTAGHLELLTATLRGPAAGAAPDERHDRRAWRIELARESSAAPDRYDGVLGPEPDEAYGLAWRPFSASQLLVLGQCPFHWFAQRLLRLREPDEKEEDVSPTWLGSLFHRALDLALGYATEEVGTAADGSLLRRAALAHLEGAFADAERELKTPDSDSWPLQRPAHLETLARAIGSPDFLSDGAAVVARESEFQTSWRGLKVTGRVDRIDRSADGLILTDYKLGKSRPLGAKDTTGRPVLDLQLPLYQEAAAPQLFKDEGVASARYYSLNGAATIGEADIDDVELEAFVARVRTHLSEGSFPVEPDLEQKACTYCEFELLCRRGPRLGRKHAARARAETLAEEIVE